MRTPMVVLAVVLGGAVAGCADLPGGTSAKAPATSPAAQASVRCDAVSELPQRIAAAQAALAPGKDATAGKAAADLVAGDLEDLADGAPADVRSVLDDFGKALQDAAAALADPSSQESDQADALARKLARDGRRVSAYVVAHCG